MIFLTQDGKIGSALGRVLQNELGVRSVSSMVPLATPSPDDLFVAAIDNCRFDLLQLWEKMSRLWKVPFLCIHVHNVEAIIGPHIYPDRPGCLHCWFKRYYSGRSRARRFSEATSTPQNADSDPWISDTTAALVAEIAAQRILDILAEGTRRLDGSLSTIYSLDLRRLTGKEWPFLPDSSCACAKPKFDSAADATLNLGSCPKLDARGDRARDIRDMEDVIHHAYVGPAGIVSGVSVSWPFHPGALALTGVDLLGSGRLEVCAGQSNRYSTARTIAVIEALERYTSALPRGRRVSVRGNASSLGDVALDPNMFGLYSRQQYQSNPDLLTPYSDQLELDFVWAYSLRRSRPVLIPRHLGFYSFIGVQDDPAFVIEGSNGCAIGSCPEEAIFHGLLEVIERDALLVNWYSQKTPPRVSLKECTDAETRCRLRLLESQGFIVKAFDTTTDFGIPAVLLLALRSDRQMPAAVCAPGAHLYPELAIKKAIRELCSMADRLRIELADQRIRYRIDQLAEDVTQTREALDHPLAYCSPASLPYFDYLLCSTQETSMEELTSRSQEIWSEDLGIELQHLMKRVLDRDLDVVLVNHTCPEQSHARLCNYKVLLPGTVPMAWGAHLQRFEGIARFQSMLQNNLPNPAPHPFA